MNEMESLRAKLAAIEKLAQQWENERAISLASVADALPTRDYLRAYVESERAARYYIGVEQLRDILKEPSK